MTTSVERIKALNAESAELGQKLVQPIINRGFDNMTDAEKDIICGFLEATIELTEAMLRWYEGPRTYEDWKLMFESANSNPAYLDLDTTGEMRRLADLVLLEDPREYFEQEVKPLEINPAEGRMQIEFTRSIIEAVRTDKLDKANVEVAPDTNVTL